MESGLPKGHPEALNQVEKSIDPFETPKGDAQEKPLTDKPEEPKKENPVPPNKKEEVNTLSEQGKKEVQEQGLWKKTGDSVSNAIDKYRMWREGRGAKKAEQQLDLLTKNQETQKGKIKEAQDNAARVQKELAAAEASIEAINKADPEGTPIKMDESERTRIQAEVETFKKNQEAAEEQLQLLEGQKVDVKGVVEGFKSKVEEARSRIDSRFDAKEKIQQEALDLYGAGLERVSTELKEQKQKKSDADKSVKELGALIENTKSPNIKTKLKEALLKVQRQSERLDDAIFLQQKKKERLEGLVVKHKTNRDQIRESRTSLKEGAKKGEEKPKEGVKFQREGFGEVAVEPDGKVTVNAESGSVFNYDSFGQMNSQDFAKLGLTTDDLDSLDTSQMDRESLQRVVESEFERRSPAELVGRWNRQLKTLDKGLRLTTKILKEVGVDLHRDYKGADDAKMILQKGLAKKLSPKDSAEVKPINPRIQARLNNFVSNLF